MRLISLRARIEAVGREGDAYCIGGGEFAQWITPDGNLRLLPGMFESDGFFVAMIEKIV